MSQPQAQRRFSADVPTPDRPNSSSPNNGTEVSTVGWGARAKLALLSLELAALDDLLDELHAQTEATTFDLGVLGDNTETIRVELELMGSGATT